MEGQTNSKIEEVNGELPTSPLNLVSIDELIREENVTKCPILQGPVLDMNVIVKRLEDPRSASILDSITGIVRVLRDSTIVIDRKAEMVQQMYETLANALQDDVIWKEGWETSFDLIETYIFDRTVQDVLARDVEDARKDEALEESIRATEHFTISALCEMENGNTEVCERIANEATKVLKGITTVNDPLGKLTIITDFNKTIIELMEKEKISTDSDHVLPMVMLTVMRAKVPLLVTNLAYVRRFRCRHRINGHAEYSMTTLIAAIQTIINIDTKHPIILFPEQNTRLKKSTSFVQPLSDLTSNFLNNVTSFPKNVSLAVRDTFTLRSARIKASSSSSLTHIDGDLGRRKSSFIEIDAPLLDNDLEMQAFQERILATNNVENLTLGEVAQMFIDYKRLLAALKHKK